MNLPQRQCWILQGEPLITQASQLYQQADQAVRCWLSDDADRPATAIGHKQAQQQLGRDNQLTVFDARHGFYADAFGALVGTLQAGGVMLILFPQQAGPSLWLQRFLHIARQHAPIRFFAGDESLPKVTWPAKPGQPQAVTATPEQTQAIQAVLRVVKGHRRRPLVISADRGRGKTALLGMAAAQLLQQGKHHIVVTAPSVSNIQPLLQHAQQSLDGAKAHRTGLDSQQGHIRFMAPDSLLENKPQTDLLIVDEAAAIPAAMLAKMLESYSRIVFATTLHGYEGTGRGFALRFQKTLDVMTPNWRAISLKQPVRWAADDQLEAFSFDALLLDAEPVADARISMAEHAELDFDLIDRHSLAEDEALLREVFGLMALAHYRTRPSDLQMLLDRDDISIAVLRYRGHVLASAWLVDEPPLDDALAEQVFAGQRRLKGQLLPQSLLVHSGLPQAGQYRYQRIIRIAVHPALQSRGLGSLLLAQLQNQIAEQGDVLGTSFAMETRLSRFWLNNGFAPVRLGQHQDEVSGSRSLMLLKAMSDEGAHLVECARRHLSREWPFLLQTQLGELASDSVVLLSSALKPFGTEPDKDYQAQVQAFASAQRPLESSQFALWRWLQQQLSTTAFQQLHPHQQQLLVKLILQQQSIDKVAESLNLLGRAAVVKKLRQAVSDCLSSNSPVETR
jgi:tRNA(Met) cytidine acetyltransferase